jgi:hypothetical protein
MDFKRSCVATKESMAAIVDGDGCRSRTTASTTVKEGRGGSLETVFVVTVGGGRISDVVIVVVFINKVEDTVLCISAGSRAGAQEVGVGGNESGSWGKTSTGGIRLASSVARLTALARAGGEGSLEAIPCTLALGLGRLPLIWMRDAKEVLDWLRDVFHPPATAPKSLPANCWKRVGLDDELGWEWMVDVRGGVEIGDGVGEWYSVLSDCEREMRLSSSGCFPIELKRKSLNGRGASWTEGSDASELPPALA